MIAQPVCPELCVISVCPLVPAGRGTKMLDGRGPSESPALFLSSVLSALFNVYLAAVLSFHSSAGKIEQEGGRFFFHYRLKCIHWPESDCSWHFTLPHFQGVVFFLDLSFFSFSFFHILKWLLNLVHLEPSLLFPSFWSVIYRQ